MGADIGKRVGGALYIHRSALSFLDEPHASALRQAEAHAGDQDWNVAKIGRRDVSLLLYEQFTAAAFPALLTSVKVNLSTGAIVRTNYRDRANPPVLHRKELLLSPNDVNLPVFRALTAAAEEYGLFNDAKKIGTRAAWEARIKGAGLAIRGQRLGPTTEEQVDVLRHRTAIVRGDLSSPMQLLIRLGVVSSGRSVFDYGCGQGEDVAALSLQGYEAFGWDPHHATEGPRKAADVVHLGFVLNVIEDAKERAETLRAAWSFAKRALCVAVMVRGKASIAGHKPFKDGFLTSRGTFQRYFEQQELRDLVNRTIGEIPLSLASGVVVAFRDKEVEQEVLLRRQARAFVAGELPRPPHRERVTSLRPDLRERLAPFLGQFRELAIGQGRLPEREEVPEDLITELSAAGISWARASQAIRVELNSDEVFASAAKARREDLLIHFAMMQFPGAAKYRSLPRSIQAHVKAFFGSYAAAQEESRRLLFMAGDRTGVREDVECAVQNGFGAYRNERSFRVRANSVTKLPIRLKILIGCAEILQGGIEASDFVDIDLETPRITMVVCDDVERPIPCIVERTHVDLSRLRVTNIRRDREPTPIYFKSRFLPVDDPQRSKQEAFEQALKSTGLFRAGAADPDWPIVRSALRQLVKGI